MNRDKDIDKKNTSYFSRFFDVLNHPPANKVPTPVVYPVRLSDPGGGAVDLTQLDPAGPLIFNPDIVYFAE